MQDLNHFLCMSYFFTELHIQDGHGLAFACGCWTENNFISRVYSEENLSSDVMITTILFCDKHFFSQEYIKLFNDHYKSYKKTSAYIEFKNKYLFR